MVERIERIARIKGVDYDVERPFERKENYQDSKKKKFAQTLNQAMRKDQTRESSMPTPYRLELSTRATQSLFYQDGLSLRQLGVNIHGNG
ncbi:MAG: hypothetical protein IKR28_00990 [Selenomonadaceae bacterium]|nr:hypothetical protein [Selenomonadaceae bacterium]